MSDLICYFGVSLFFFFKQKTAYEMRISDWSSDVCSSDLAAHAGIKDRLHATTAKGAVAAMARGLAHDLAADGITVNCLSPGPIDTVRGASAGVLPKGVGDNILLGRKGRPEESAAMVRGLCGPAGRFVTGQTNIGRTAGGERRGGTGC